MRPVDVFSDKQVLITGGIGSNLTRRLVELRANVTRVDSLIPEYGGNLFNIDGIEDRCGSTSPTCATSTASRVKF